MAWHGHDKPFNVPGPLHDDSPKSLTPLYHSLFSSFPSPPHPISRASLSRLLYDSLSLSAWKTTGFSTWSLRVNPSSGNLHPTKVYFLSPPFPDGDPPSLPPLSSPTTPPKTTPSSSTPASISLPSSSIMTAPSFSSLSFIFWREAWKYGERALHYCNHDVGHALAALPSAGTPTSSMASATMTSTSSSASTVPTLCCLPSFLSASFTAASSESSPSIRTAPSSSSPSASCPYGRAVPGRRAVFFKPSTVQFNGLCWHGSVL